MAITSEMGREILKIQVASYGEPRAFHPAARAPDPLRPEPYACEGAKTVRQSQYRATPIF